MRRISSSAPSLLRSSSIVRQARAFPVTTIFVSVAFELVSQRATHTLEQDRVVRMLEDAAVTLLLDVLQVIAGLALRGIVLAHIAKPSGKFREALTVSAIADPAHREMLRR